MYEQQQIQESQANCHQNNKVIGPILLIIAILACFLALFHLIGYEEKKKKQARPFIIEQVMIVPQNFINQKQLDKELQQELIESYDGVVLGLEDWMNKGIWNERNQEKNVKSNSYGSKQGKNLHQDTLSSFTQQISFLGQKMQRKQIIKNSPKQRLSTGISQHKIQQWKQFIKLKEFYDLAQITEIQRQYYEQEYKISTYPELPFCVIVPTYQNMENNRSISNIQSILQQNYSNYRVFIIDDFSSDGTGEKIKQYLSQIKISQTKVKVLINGKRQMAMSNIYRAAHNLCEKYELFVLVDGDDQLVGRHVFKLFNAVFQINDVWVAYSNFLTTLGQIGYSRAYSRQTIKNNKYRISVFTISHLRVFYTKLFTLIKEQDLKNDQGQWFHASNDVAMYIPMLQMSHKRIIYIPEITYLYNLNTGLNNHKIRIQEQKDNQKTIKGRQQYQQLAQLFTNQEIQELKKNTIKFQI